MDYLVLLIVMSVITVVAYRRRAARSAWITVANETTVAVWSSMTKGFF